MAPQFNKRDGSGTTQALFFTTNLEHVVFTGVLDANTADVQVSIDGGDFVSDPTLVHLDGTTFTIPNPTANPDGYPLKLGQNSISIRAIDIVGGVSAVANATVIRVQTVVDAVQYIPSGISVQRKRDAIDLLIAKPSNPYDTGSELMVPTPLFQGFNVYAAPSPGGATTGYFRVNETLVNKVAKQEEIKQTLETYTITKDSEADVLRVQVSQEDVFGDTVAVHMNTTTDTSMLDEKFRFSGTLESYTLQDYVVFTHDRKAGPNADQFSEIPDEDPLYYVVTSVYWDPTTNTEFESPYSQEVLGRPFILDTKIRDLPNRTQSQIVVDYITAIQRVNTEISLIPGSTTRDISIDPFSSEMERVWFLLDFVHRSQSFLTLLQIDDANGDGESDEVVSSAYKQALKAALGLTQDTAVQQLIDAQFDKLAANYRKERLPGRPAVGQVVFYTKTKPTKDLTIASGSIVWTDADASGNVARFRVGGTYTMKSSQIDSYYNFDEKRWEITADIVAEAAGEAGNRPAGQIKYSSVAQLSCINTESTVYGTDVESNASLAERCMLAFESVDSGTEGGLLAIAAKQVGIVKAKVVKSGDALMMRDWDPVREKHIGGKVDVWVQGLRERQVSSTFAFSFAIAKDIRCQIVDVAALKFRVLDPRVTVDHPLTELLDNPAKGLGVRNVTKGEDYDLTGVVILDHQTFQLDNTIAQPATATDDVITADYRFRLVNAFVFNIQPVRRVVSVVGEVSGTLSEDTGYDLYQTDDPLLNGRSTIAQDNLVIHQVGGIPTGDSIIVNDETHVLVGLFQEPLNSIGVNTYTLRVYNEERTIEYNGPSSSAPDFDIIEGTTTTPVKIVRTATSRILSGQEVSVDYEHDENFVVTYVVNDLLQELQTKIDAKRHITADVLVKQAVANEVAIETTVVLKDGATRDVVDPAIRTNISNDLNSRLIGQGIAQSDIVADIDNTDGVDYQVLPFLKMAYADGSQRLREPVLSTATRLPSLDMGNYRAYILTNPLQAPTIDKGGAETQHTGVFQDDVVLPMAESLNAVALKEAAFIIGSTGAVIPGYSDNATLIAEGFTETEDIEAERLRRTANHVVVALNGSTVPPDEPMNHTYTVSYFIYGDSGAHDIVATAMEFPTLGECTITVDDH